MRSFGVTPLGAAGLVATLHLAVAGCGAPTTSASSGGKAGADSAATRTEESRCFELANAVHEKKPGEPDAVKVSHILVEHRDARNPKSGITRSRGEACLRALEAQKKLAQGADFSKLVSEYSDSPGVSGDGSMGEVRRSDLEPKFADAAFQLERGQMSDVVETAFGFHVIVRTE